MFDRLRVFDCLFDCLFDVCVSRFRLNGVCLPGKNPCVPVPFFPFEIRFGLRTKERENGWGFFQISTAQALSQTIRSQFHTQESARLQHITASRAHNHDCHSNQTITIAIQRSKITQSRNHESTKSRNHEQGPRWCSARCFG